MAFLYCRWRVTASWDCNAHTCWGYQQLWFTHPDWFGGHIFVLAIAGFNTVLIRAASTDILLGRGIPPLSKRLVEEIFSWECVDFTEVPPTRGLSKQPHARAKHFTCPDSGINPRTKDTARSTNMNAVFSIYVSVLVFSAHTGDAGLLPWDHEGKASIQIFNGHHGWYTMETVAVTWLRSGNRIGQR